MKFLTANITNTFFFLNKMYSQIKKASVFWESKLNYVDLINRVL